jgi:hypothetical protein
MRSAWPSPNILALMGLSLGLASAAWAGPGWGFPDAPGRLLGVRVEVEGSATPLYPDPRGTGRFYLEARRGARYEIHLENRTHHRLGAVVTVDGLNVISGELDTGQGRMYVLDPWGHTIVRGWRTSLADVRRFTFVDEKASYAVRSDKANGRLGWIEISVYRERTARRCCDYVRPQPYPGSPRSDDWSRDEGFEDDQPTAAAPAPSTSPLDRAEAEGSAESADAQEKSEAGSRARPAPAEAGRGLNDATGRSKGALAPPAGRRPQASPGTGWGPRTDDPVVVVSFDPEASPAERVTLRYEYAPALRALGIGVFPEAARDRLSERERGDWGFAKPPVR